MRTRAVSQRLIRLRCGYGGRCGCCRCGARWQAHCGHSRRRSHCGRRSSWHIHVDCGCSRRGRQACGRRWGCCCRQGIYIDGGWQRRRRLAAGGSAWQARAGARPLATPANARMALACAVQSCLGFPTCVILDRDFVQAQARQANEHGDTFWQAADVSRVRSRPSCLGDGVHGMARLHIHCRRCGRWLKSCSRRHDSSHHGAGSLVSTVLTQQ